MGGVLGFLPMQGRENFSTLRLEGCNLRCVSLVKLVLAMYNTITKVIVGDFGGAVVENGIDFI